MGGSHSPHLTVPGMSISRSLKVGGGLSLGSRGLWGWEWGERSPPQDKARDAEQLLTHTVSHQQEDLYFEAISQTFSRASTIGRDQQGPHLLRTWDASLGTQLTEKSVHGMGEWPA